MTGDGLLGVLYDSNPPADRGVCQCLEHDKLQVLGGEDKIMPQVQSLPAVLAYRTRLGGFGDGFLSGWSEGAQSNQRQPRLWRTTPPIETGVTSES